VLHALSHLRGVVNGDNDLLQFHVELCECTYVIVVVVVAVVVVIVIGYETNFE
jgi:hypothetical protein